MSTGSSGEIECYSSDPGSTTWVLTSTALVLAMNPALAFFEAGMLRSKNTLSIVVQIFTGVITLSLMWFCFGYSLTYGDDQGGFIGTFQYSFFIDVDYFECSIHAKHVPAAVFAIFQMMFAVITPLLMTGAYAERMKFKIFFIFTILWEILIYYPVAHWIWGGGFLAKWGVLDFAGGITIHTTAGAGSLVTALYLGRRTDYFSYMGEFPPSSLPLAATGMALLWVGWYGFNGGSALQAGSVAVSAVVSSQIGAVSSGFIWLVLSWWQNRPSASALLNGCLAGLAGVTPASGYINSPSTILLGVILGVSSYYSVHLMKHKLHIDDALDVSSVHGLTGALGSIFLGLFAQLRLNPLGADGAVYGNPALLGKQVVAVLLCGVYAAVLSYMILKVLEWIYGDLRVNEIDEDAGLDYSEHGEIAYHKLHVLEDNEKTLYEPPQVNAVNINNLNNNNPSNGMVEENLHEPSQTDSMRSRLFNSTLPLNDHYRRHGHEHNSGRNSPTNGRGSGSGRDSPNSPSTPTNRSSIGPNSKLPPPLQHINRG